MYNKIQTIKSRPSFTFQANSATDPRGRPMVNIKFSFIDADFRFFKPKDVEIPGCTELFTYACFCRIYTLCLMYN